MNYRQNLVDKIIAQQTSPGDAVASLEDFFAGNDDLGSIGCNLGRKQPSIDTFFDILKGIRSRAQVQDVLVRICEFDDPTCWPFSDTVYILSSTSLDQVQQWVAPLKPDEVYAEWMYDAPPNAPRLNPGFYPYSIWWD